MDLITQSPVISLVVSLPTLPEPSLRALQNPMSLLGCLLRVGWGQAQPGCPCPGPRDEESALSGQMGKSQRC